MSKKISKQSKGKSYLVSYGKTFEGKLLRLNTKANNSRSKYKMSEDANLLYLLNREEDMLNGTNYRR